MTVKFPALHQVVPRTESFISLVLLTLPSAQTGSYGFPAEQNTRCLWSPQLQTLVAKQFILFFFIEDCSNLSIQALAILIAVTVILYEAVAVEVHYFYL